MNERLKNLRKRLELSQEEFGKRIGITKSSVSKLETGENSPSEQTIKLICSEFNINEMWLRAGKGEMFIELDRDEEIAAWASKITRSDYGNKFVPEFAHVLTKLDESDWEVLEKIARLLIENRKKD
ncbi:helix-turn-helix domain-containing protein [Lacrimispora sp. 210928-DFI.3.58]|uniref:helix-turn-helix domain-containing protein n=1 Tax=Lacrimispora sp. 210928-DFI.3.58 TaxID=2883214 RepID=UPI001D066C5A|nr:helix-turn-helix transcriptional regulator [Lacrimispora sp. 210928-DFI.3.58]MCB7321292.1 helix-turn-helix transcriptional regulator [Lacrimispora sp. 210928-DFI.3.58]